MSMSGGHQDPVEILDDESSESSIPRSIPTKQKDNDNPNPSTSGTKQTMTDGADKEQDINMLHESDEDDAESGEYSVEAIRARRKNTKTGADEYFIKWKGYPESDNTWEPLENLKCPELMQKFHEKEATKRRKKRAGKQAESTPQPAKRLRRGPSLNGNDETSNNEEEKLFLEDLDEDDDDDTAMSQSQSQKKQKNGSKHKENRADPVSLKGFERGLPLERILTASVGDDDKLYFFLKWEGRNELDMVDADELEQKASYELCKWYRNRLYWKGNDDSQRVQ